MKAEGLPVVSISGGGEYLSPSLLVPGRTYMVAVLQREGTQALVSIGGRRIHAEVIGQFPDAGRVPVLIREASSDRVLLQRAPERSLDLTTGGLERSDLASVLQLVGLPSKAEYLLCLPHMLREGQPITPQALLDLYEAWMSLADGAPQSLPVLARLQADGLPLIDETLAAARRWEGPRPFITADSLLRLGQQLANLAQKLEAEPQRPQLDPLPAFARALARGLVSLPLTHGTDPSLPSQLAGLMESLSTPLEALLARLPSRPTWQPSPMPGRTEPSGDAEPPVLPVVASGQEQEEPGEHIVVHNRGSLPRGLPALERNANLQMRRLETAIVRLGEQGQFLSAATREALQAVRSGLREVIHSLDAQHIANLRSAPDATVPHFYAFSIPIAWSGLRDQAGLRVYYRPGRGRHVDPQDTQLAFRLDLEGLGAIEIDLRVFRRVASCEIRTESTAVNQLAIEEAPGLQSGLQKLGYHVQGVRCSLQPSSGATVGGPALELPRELLRVDVVG